MNWYRLLAGLLLRVGDAAFGGAALSRYTLQRSRTTKHNCPQHNLLLPVQAFEALWFCPLHRRCICPVLAGRCLRDVDAGHGGEMARHDQDDQYLRVHRQTSAFESFCDALHTLSICSLRWSRINLPSVRGWGTALAASIQLSRRGPSSSGRASSGSSIRETRKSNGSEARSTT